MKKDNTVVVDHHFDVEFQMLGVLGNDMLTR